MRSGVRPGPWTQVTGRAELLVSEVGNVAGDKDPLTWV